MRNFLSFAIVEDLTFGEAALYSLIGFVLILLVLTALALLISLLNYLTKKSSKKQQASNKEADEDTTPAPGSCGQVKLFDVPDKEAAMLMAIVANELKTPLNELKFVSIKEKKENKD